jgi:hypothetical protein
VIPCATCWNEDCQASLRRVPRETHDYDTSAKWIPCPDCGVETPEAAVLVAEIERLRATLDRVDHIFYGWSYDSVYGCIENMRLAVRESLAAGWTPPRGTE